MKSKLPIKPIIQSMLVMLILLYATIKHHNIYNKSNNFQEIIEKSTKYNPMQWVVNGLYFTIQYSIDFLHFRGQTEEIERLVTQNYFLMDNIHKIMQQNQELNQIIQTLTTFTEDPRPSFIVKLNYSIINQNIKKVYFNSTKPIKLNSLVVQKNCLLGRVISKKNNTYTVLLAEDPQFRLPVYTKESKTLGVLHGGTYFLKFVPFSEIALKTEQGESILTTAFEGEFTENIAIGKLHKTNKGMIVKNKCKNYYTYAIIF